MARASISEKRSFVWPDRVLVVTSPTEAITFDCFGQLSRPVARAHPYTYVQGAAVFREKDAGQKVRFS
jgi:hypothetical protein